MKMSVVSEVKNSGKWCQMVAKVVTRDLSLGVKRAPHVTRSLCLPKSLSSQSLLPVQTRSFYYPLVERESRSK